MSGFSSVDGSADPGRLVHFLDDSASAESGIKHYAAAAHARRQPDGPILDVGCGAGHDLGVLARFGLAAVGADPSAVMLAAARDRARESASPLVRAFGEALPLATECSLDAVSNACSCTSPIRRAS